MQELQVNKELLLDNDQLPIRNPKVEINWQLTTRINAIAKSIVWKSLCNNLSYINSYCLESK